MAGELGGAAAVAHPIIQRVTPLVDSCCWQEKTVPDVLDSPPARRKKTARRRRFPPAILQMFRFGLADVVATRVVLLTRFTCHGAGAAAFRADRWRGWGQGWVVSAGQRE